MARDWRLEDVILGRGNTLAGLCGALRRCFRCFVFHAAKNEQGPGEVSRRDAPSRVLRGPPSGKAGWSWRGCKAASGLRSSERAHDQRGELWSGLELPPSSRAPASTELQHAALPNRVQSKYSNTQARFLTVHLYDCLKGAGAEQPPRLRAFFSSAASSRLRHEPPVLDIRCSAETQRRAAHLSIHTCPTCGSRLGSPHALQQCSIRRPKWPAAREDPPGPVLKLRLVWQPGSGPRPIMGWIISLQV